MKKPSNTLTLLIRGHTNTPPRTITVPHHQPHDPNEKFYKSKRMILAFPVLSWYTWNLYKSEGMILDFPVFSGYTWNFRASNSKCISRPPYSSHWASSTSLSFSPVSLLLRAHFMIFISLTDRIACNANNCLRALRNPKHSIEASDFCSSYIPPVSTVTNITYSVTTLTLFNEATIPFTTISVERTT